MPAYYLEILVLVLGFTMLGWESFSSSRSRAGIANLGVAGLLIAFLFLFTVAVSYTHLTLPTKA